MTKQFIGDACAHLGVVNGKSKYVRVGSAFTDDEGRITVKVDTLPLASTNWQGWINVFPPRGKETHHPPEIPNDEIPF